jgi:hypothetical protein
MLLITILALLLPPKTYAINFDWERDQLTESKALTDKAFQFGSSNATPLNGCRTIPGDEDWPTEADWSVFNDTLGGVLLKPKPLASICYSRPNYNAQRCSQLKQTWSDMNLQ